MPRDTVHRQATGPLASAISLGFGAFEAAGLIDRQLSADAICERAMRETGLSDFGHDRFLEPMRQMMSAVNNANLSPFGRAIERGLALRGASNRLQLEDLYKKHPEIESTPVERPVFVVGFPRTGTTVLQNLLCQQRGWRGLEQWELSRPAPVHHNRERDIAKRKRMAANDLRGAYAVTPEMGAIHAIGPTTFEECWYLFTHSFKLLNLDIAHGLEQYGDWLLQQSLTDAYTEYRRALKALLWRRPASRLVVKCPEHLWFLDDLLRVFPDACIVWTHRDPFKVVASYSSMTALTRRTLYGSFDPRQVGEHIERRFAEGVSRAMRVKHRLPASRFYDVDFNDLVEDPGSVVRDIKSHFRLEHDASTDASMARYLAAKRSDARGKHIYTPERFGLQRDAVHETFAGYLSEHAIAA
jgi:hypothetical protein